MEEAFEIRRETHEELCICMYTEQYKNTKHHQSPITLNVASLSTAWLGCPRHPSLYVRSGARLLVICEQNLMP